MPSPSGIRFTLDRRLGVPPYLQIVEQVRQAIHTGLLGVGDQLPSVSEVVRLSAVNANTVMKAYRELEYQGIVRPLQGVGTKVVALPAGAKPELLESYRSRIKALLKMATLEGLDTEALRHLTNAILLDLTLEEKSASDQG